MGERVGEADKDEEEEELDDVEEDCPYARGRFRARAKVRAR